MDRLLSERAVLDAIEDEWHGCTGEYPASTIINDTCQRIEQLPSAQPERTGKWLPEYGDPSARAHYCSACNFYYTTYPEEMNYCPHCGAKMEVEHDT